MKVATIHYHTAEEKGKKGGVFSQSESRPLIKGSEGKTNQPVLGSASKSTKIQEQQNKLNIGGNDSVLVKWQSTTMTTSTPKKKRWDKPRLEVILTKSNNANSR